MQVVIDIPKEYRSIFEENSCKEKFDSLATNEFGYMLRKAFENGTPLPKGHGRLIDADAITKDVETLQNSFVINMDNITGKILGCECLAPTIIERSDANECNL